MTAAVLGHRPRGGGSIRRLLSVLALSLLPAAVGSAQSGEAAGAESPAAEQLLVFVQPDVSEVDRRFVEEQLPALQSLADRLGLGLELHELGPQTPVPEAVRITPLVVFQNHRGRSIYQGRTTTPERVETFVRTARFLPQGEERRSIDGAGVQRLGAEPDGGEGGVYVAVPIKVTLPTGASLPGSATGEEFAAQMAEAILSGPFPLGRPDLVELGRTDRLFYADFYPHVGDDGLLYVATALFSQFNCHVPVFEQSGEAVRGPLGEAEDLFRQAAAELNAALHERIESSAHGDGFAVVPADRRWVSWEDAGLALPAAGRDERTAGPAAEDLTLGRDWVIDRDAQADQPAVIFSFPAPLDGYAGQVLDVDGRVTLGPGLELTAMRGRISADPASVTMGESDLDAAVHDSMLEVGEYEDSRFEIDAVESRFERLAFGELAAATLHGQFTMRGRSIPLSVPMSVEPYVGLDGRPRLAMTGTWQIRLLEPFGIDGPPGDSPTNDTLIYRGHFVFEPGG